MAEVRHRHFKSDTTFNTTSATPTIAYTIGTLAQVPTGDWMIIPIGLFAATSGGTSNNNRKIELHDNGTLIDTDTNSRVQPEVTEDGVGHPYGILRRFTKNVSGDVTLEAYNDDSVNVAVMACEALLYNLDDMVENTDFLFAEITVDDANVGGTYVDGASITLPAGASDKWMVWAFTRWDSGTTTESSFLKIIDDATSRGEISSQNNDVNDLQCMLTGYPIDGAAGTKTVKLQYKAGTTNDLRYSAIFVVRLTQFKFSAFAESGIATVVAADTFVEAESLNFTATHTGEHCVMGGTIFTCAAASNRRERRITSEVGGGGETTIAGSATRQIVANNGTVDLLPASMVAGVSYTNSDSVDLDLDVGDDINNTNESVAESFIVCHSWELAGAGGGTSADFGGIARGVSRGIGKGI